MRKPVPLLVLCISLLPLAATADVTSATKRAKAGDFDSTAEVRCAQEVGEALEPCAAAVARVAEAAVLVVTFPNGFKRSLIFEGDSFLRGNTTMSGTGTDTDWSQSDGMYKVRVDDQQFEIPVHVISGK